MKGLPVFLTVPPDLDRLDLSSYLLEELGLKHTMTRIDKTTIKLTADDGDNLDDAVQIELAARSYVRGYTAI